MVRRKENAEMNVSLLFGSCACEVAELASYCELYRRK